MPTKSKQNMDQIDPIENQIADSGEEKVISVRIPKKKDAGETLEKASNEEVIEESKSESAKEDTIDETKDDSLPSKESVASFSLLDAEKGEAKPTDANTSPEVSEVKPTESEVKSSDIEKDVNSQAETKDPKEQIREWLDDVDTKTSDSGEESGGGSKLKVFFIFVIIAVLLGVIGGGLYYYQKNAAPSEESTITPTPQPTVPSATPQPETTPEPIDLESISVSVLNGSGKAGEAGKASTLLTEAGFGKATASNADSSDYTKTIVYLKDDAPKGLYEQIAKVLGESYVVELSKDELDTDSKFDVEIIIGSSEPEESEPSE